MPPPDWYSGDTHVHVQPCGGGPDIDVGTIVQEQLNAGVDVACGLYWNEKYDLEGQLEFYSTYVPQVTGLEHPVTEPLAGVAIQFGVEVAGFSGDQFGHLIGIGIVDGAFPDVKFPGPILEFFRDQPGALAGYAHVRWPLNYTALSQGQLFHLVPAMLPVDLAMGAVDFLEAPTWDPTDQLDWRGAYYKLLNAGLRVSLAAGSDNTCMAPAVGGMRTFARVEGPGLDFSRWLEAVGAGRTTISKDGAAFLNLELGTDGIGSQVALAAPGPVVATLTLSVPVGVASLGTLRVIQNGISVDEIPVDLPQGGDLVHTPTIDFPDSGWLAAAYDGAAHTGAIYVIVGDQPIASKPDCVYLRSVCEQLIAPEPPFDTFGATEAIAERASAAMATFEALGKIEGSLPAGITRYGVSTQACDGPIAIGANQAAVAGGEPVLLTCVHAPPNTTGFLVVGQDQDLLPIELLGAGLYIDLESPFLYYGKATGPGGYAAREFLLPATSSGHTFRAQYVWFNTTACPGASLLCASDVLDITIQ